MLLLAVGYFVATSNAFFQRVILPRLGRSLDATVTVAQASIHPFSQVILRDLKIQPRGEEPVLTAKELRFRYHLLDMLGGQIAVEEAVIDSPTLRIIGKADGTSNLDPILKSLSQGKPSPTRPSPPPSKPTRVDLKRLVVSHAVLNLTQTGLEGETLRAEIPDLNLELAGVKNDQTARFTLAAGFEVNATSQTNVSKATGTLKSDFTTDLGGDLMPNRVEGLAELAIPTATGAFAEASGLTATFKAGLSATEVKQLAWQFAKGGASLGDLIVSGPLNLRTGEGHLNLAVNGIGREVLNLAGARYGVSFGDTKLAAKCELVLTNQAKRISASGTLTGAACSLTRGQLATPKMDFQLDYNLAADLLATNVILRQFSVNVTQDGNPLLRGALTREMRIDWGQGGNAVPDSTLELALTQLDLARWQALAGDSVMSGILSGKLGLTAQKAGRSVSFELASQLDNLSARYQSNTINGLSLGLAIRGQVAEFSQVDLADFNLQAARAGQSLISVKGSGKYNTLTAEASLQTELEASLAPASALLAPPDGPLQSGSLKFTGRLARRNPTPGPTNPPAVSQEIVGDLQLTNLVIRAAAGRPPQKPIEARLKLNAALTQGRLELRQAQLLLTPTDRARNQLELAGQVDMGQSNLVTGNLKLTAESLDLTSFYDAYGGGPQPPAVTTPTPPASAPAAPETEPAAVELPLRKFVGVMEIGQVYLRELAISHLGVTAHIDGGKVKLDPVQWTLNGASGSAKVDLNLGVPGYQYLVDLQTRDIPLAPLANTFQPDRKGLLGGTLTALAQVAGVGVTGPNLRKNLAAKFDIGTTNLNLKLVDVRSSLLKSVINAVIGLPDIIRNPAGALGSIVKNLSGSGETGGGWVDELSKSPIEVIVFRGEAGKGRVDVQRAQVQSLAFQVETQGPITLAPILTNSTIEFPVALALRRSLAEKIGQVTSETPTNAMYVKLPDFLTMQGTLGDPQKKLNYPALAKMALQMGGGIVGGSAQAAIGQVTGTLGGLKDAFGGKGSTNPSTNAPSGKGVLSGLLPERSAPATNQPPATNAAPKKSGLLDLLK